MLKLLGLIFPISAIFVQSLHAQAGISLFTAQDTARAVKTLNQYLEMRVHDANWNKYSSLVTWPEEPSWDCKWVIAKYELLKPSAKGEKIEIPVISRRTGLYCYDFNFKAEPKDTTIAYELINIDNKWKIKGPIPDYPEIGARALVHSLEAIAANPKETRDRQERARAMALEIRQSLGDSDRDGWKRTSNQGGPGTRP